MPTYFKEESLTQIYDLTPPMIGDRTDKQLKLKASETWTFLLFIIDQLRPLYHLPYHRELLAAGQALIELNGVWKLSPWRMPANMVQQSFDLYNRFLECTDAIDGYRDFFKPKRHIAVHLLRDLTHFGCPKVYANWLNESLNKTLKGCCRNVSQLRFEESVLAGMRHLMKRRSFEPSY